MTSQEETKPENPYAVNLQASERQSVTETQTRFDATAHAMLLLLVLLISVRYGLIPKVVGPQIAEFAATACLIGIFGAFVGLCLGSQSVERVECCMSGGIVGFLAGVIVSLLVATADPLFLLAAIPIILAAPIVLRFRRA